MLSLKLSFLIAATSSTLFRTAGANANANANEGRTATATAAATATATAARPRTMVVDRDTFRTQGTLDAYNNVRYSCAMDVDLFCSAPEPPVYYIVSSSSFLSPSFLSPSFLSPSFLLLLDESPESPWSSSSSSNSASGSIGDMQDFTFFFGNGIETWSMSVLDQTFSDFSMFVPLEESASALASLSTSIVDSSPGEAAQDETNNNNNNNNNNNGSNNNNNNNNLLRSANIGSEQTEIIRHRRRLTGIDENSNSNNNNGNGNGNNDGGDHDSYIIELPFRCRNDCLRNAYRERLVSEVCARSIDLLENAYALEKKTLGLREVEEEEANRDINSKKIDSILFQKRTVMVVLLVLMLMLVLEILVNNEDNENDNENDGDTTTTEEENKQLSIIGAEKKNVLFSETICCEGIPVQVV